VFNNLGWEELLVLAIVGLVIFGPDRLPGAIKDATKMLRELRNLARGAANDLKAELGPELADLDLRSLNPRRLVEDAIFGEDEPKKKPKNGNNGNKSGPKERPPVLALAANERPPYDADAT
jgi:sec-independent protein translocase protein TatB